MHSAPRLPSFSPSYSPQVSTLALERLQVAVLLGSLSALGLFLLLLLLLLVCPTNQWKQRLESKDSCAVQLAA